MRSKVIELMGEIAKSGELTLVDPLLDDTELLSSGLDSLGFAMLIARLEEELGYDPFTLMDEPVYPHTLGELVTIYQRFSPER